MHVASTYQFTKHMHICAYKTGSGIYPVIGKSLWGKQLLSWTSKKIKDLNTQRKTQQLWQRVLQFPTLTGRGSLSSSDTALPCCLARSSQPELQISALSHPLLLLGRVKVHLPANPQTQNIDLARKREIGLSHPTWGYWSRDMGFIKWRVHARVLQRCPVISWSLEIWFPHPKCSWKGLERWLVGKSVCSSSNPQHPHRNVAWLLIPVTSA